MESQDVGRRNDPFHRGGVAKTIWQVQIPLVELRFNLGQPSPPRYPACCLDRINLVSYYPHDDTYSPLWAKILAGLTMNPLSDAHALKQVIITAGAGVWSISGCVLGGHISSSSDYISTRWSIFIVEAYTRPQTWSVSGSAVSKSPSLIEAVRPGSLISIVTKARWFLYPCRSHTPWYYVRLNHHYETGV